MVTKTKQLGGIKIFKHLLQFCVTVCVHSGVCLPDR